MSHNNFMYRFCSASEQAKREAVGYKGRGSISTNGELVVGDKGDDEMVLGDLTVPTKPTYPGIPALDLWPWANYQDTLAVLAIFASVKGGDDGYSFNEAV